MFLQDSAAVSGPLHTDPIVIQAVTSYLITNGIELLKKSRLPWISQHSVGLNKTLSVAAAALASLGITFGYTGDLFAGGTISFAFPGLSTMLSLGINGTFGLMLQEMFYQKAVREPKPEALTLTGTVLAPSGRPVGEIALAGVAAEAGSQAARVAAGEILPDAEKKP